MGSHRKSNHHGSWTRYWTLLCASAPNNLFLKLFPASVAHFSGLYIFYMYLFEGVCCLQTIRHLCPCVRCSPPVPAEILSGKRHVPGGLYRYPAPNSSLKSFWLKIVFSLRFGVHVFSWPRFLSTGSALGALGSKRLHYYTTFRVHISETIISTDSKFELCTRICTFELLAAVL